MAENIRNLMIDGVELPTPAHNGVTVSSNKIWSSNTGRTSTGKMVGTIIGIKSKLEIKWPPLTEEQVAIIESVVSNASSPFVRVQYTDMTGRQVAKTMYFGDVSYSQYSWSDGIRYVTDVSVSAIEQ